MLTRHGKKAELARAEEHLSRMGITQTEAAERLGVTRWHLNRVLRGHRESKRILRGIAAMTRTREVGQIVVPGSSRKGVAA